MGSVLIMDWVLMGSAFSLRNFMRSASLKANSPRRSSDGFDGLDLLDEFKLELAP
jgi:hypothetical protein